MSYLLDTSILTRLINATDTQHAQATFALQKLVAEGEDLCITAQNIIEFWTVATRPTEVNGLGLSTTDASAHVLQFMGAFIFLEDDPAIFQSWQALVNGAAVSGKQAHDARLAAVALSYGVPNILTFNDRHFLRFVRFGVTPINPGNV